MANDDQDEGAGAEIRLDDYKFPTSARPVFQKVGLLVAAVIALCVLAYACAGESSANNQTRRDVGLALVLS